MTSFRISAAAKGQFKCFRCRVLTKSKDGSWHQDKNQQIFVCKGCDRPAAAQPKATIAPSINLN